MVATGSQTRSLGESCDGKPAPRLASPIPDSSDNDSWIVAGIIVALNAKLLFDAVIGRVDADIQTSGKFILLQDVHLT